MKSLTFIIPVRIDNANRRDNLQTSLKYLTHAFPESEFFLVEDSSEPNCASICTDYKIHYHFIRNTGCFSRSNAINQVLTLATREYVMPYDLDILIPVDQILQSIKILEKRKKHIILPHNSILVDVCDPLKAKLTDNLNLKIIPRFRCLWFKNNRQGINLISSGTGVVIFRRNILIKIGGFNSKMKSYGWEDTEVLKRAAKLGIFYYSLFWGNIIHLHHARGADSKQNEFYMMNKKEYLKVVSMTPFNLINYIKRNLAIDNDNCIKINEYMNIRRQNLLGLNFILFAFNRGITKLLDFRFKGFSVS